MKPTLFIPADTVARALGADEIAAALTPHAASITRTSSRALTWLEPLIEVGTATGRIAYGPITPNDIPDLLAAGFLTGAPHPLRIGAIESHPFLARQSRKTFCRAGLTDPLSLTDYKDHGGLKGLAAAQSLAPEKIIKQVEIAGLRGRGGAGFPTAIKWRTAAATRAPQRYLIANGDEGDSGSFADRLIMEGDPFLLIEGMIIAALAIGATAGIIYIRSEYPASIANLTAALATARAHHLLGPDFDIELRVGAGSYVCGEETALMESIEGRAGTVRAKPPLPAISGLYGMPTIINNVLTLAEVPRILAEGGESFRADGIGRSRGTMAVQLAGNIKHGGLIEVPFGITLEELIDDFGGGTASGRPVRAIQIGGPLGAWFPREIFHARLGYEEIAAEGGILGHGGIVVADDTVNMAQMARYAMEVCAIESCGKCTPCRIGSTRGVEILDRVIAGDASEIPLLEDLCETMQLGSLCALGGFTPNPVLSALKYFAGDFQDASFSEEKEAKRLLSVGGGL